MKELPSSDEIWDVLPLKGEVVSGLLTSFCIAPLVAIVDKAIFSNASGKMAYNESFRDCTFSLLLTPKKFFLRKSFFWSWSVYAATFIMSNCCDRFARTINLSSPRTFQFFGTALVNIPLSTMRDLYLTQMHGSVVPRRIDTRTCLAFIARDLITIMGAFTAIRPVAAYFTHGYYVPWSISQLMSQIFCPMIAQLLNTPIFLYGLDVYYRPNASSSQRMEYIWDHYWDTYYWARIARVGPAYSVGGVINMTFRYLLTPPYPDYTVKEKDDKKVVEDVVDDD